MYIYIYIYMYMAVSILYPYRKVHNKRKPRRLGCNGQSAGRAGGRPARRAGKLKDPKLVEKMTLKTTPSQNDFKCISAKIDKNRV